MTYVCTRPTYVHTYMGFWNWTPQLTNLYFEKTCNYLTIYKKKKQKDEDEFNIILIIFDLFLPISL